MIIGTLLALIIGAVVLFLGLPVFIVIAGFFLIPIAIGIALALAFLI